MAAAGFTLLIACSMQSFSRSEAETGFARRKYFVTIPAEVAFKRIEMERNSTDKKLCPKCKQVIEIVPGEKSGH